MKLYDTTPQRGGIRALLHFAREYRRVRLNTPPQITMPPQIAEALQASGVSAVATYQPATQFAPSPLDEARMALTDAAYYTSEAEPLNQTRTPVDPILARQSISFAIRYTLTIPGHLHRDDESDARRQMWWAYESERFMSQIVASGEQFLREVSDGIELGSKR